MPSIYHLQNFLKFRIMECLVKNRPNAMTCKQISEQTGIPASNISRVMSHYEKNRYGYFRRLKTTHSKAYMYKINKYGRQAYLKYLRRIKLGFDLNMKNRVPVRMSTFRGYQKVSLNTAIEREVKPEELAPYLGVFKGKNNLPEGQKI